MQNKVYIKIFIIILFFQNVQLSFSQVSTDLMKYWYYRNRLKYFVVPGDKIGESQIVCTRNKIYNWPSSDNPNDSLKKNIDYGQHGKHQGLYIGTLATEYYLLKENGQTDDATNTLNELYYSLYSVNKYWDSLAEPFWGERASLNGFFIRGNVPCDFLDSSNTFNNWHGFTKDGKTHLSLLNKGLKSTDVWNGNTKAFGNFERGHPGYVDHIYNSECEGVSNSTPNTPTTFDGHPESMSQDEAIGILLGCALAAELAEETEAQKLAIDMADRIILYITNIGGFYGNNLFRIYKPDGTKVRRKDGGVTYPYGPGLFETGYQITGKGYYRLQEFYSFIGLAQLLVWEIAIRDLDNSQDLAASILAMGNYSRNRISWLTDNKKNWDTFYLLLWEVLNHKTLRPNNQSKLLGKSLTQMDAAPCEGPYCYRSDYDDSGENWQGGGIYAGGGWATDYRWFKKERQQNFGQWCTGNYNGLDYMLLYNLYHIMTKEESPSYVNYCDKKLAGIVNSPIKFVGFNSITSTQTINNTEPTVVYKAGDYINLKPGFHVENGSNFHAFIENINCSGTDYPNNIFTPSYDELISIPQDSYIVKIADDSASSVLNFTLPCPNDTIKFNGLFGDNNEDNYLYYWDFGNGQTSTLENPEIFYDTPGTYNMSVIYTDTSNISDTFKIDIIVPDCKLYGTCVLTCLADTSGNIVPLTFEGDSVLIMHNNLPVSSVSPAILQYNGSYNFNLSQILQLNPTALYQLAIRVPDHYHGIMDSYMHYLTDEATINQLILNSPHYTNQNICITKGVKSTIDSSDVENNILKNQFLNIIPNPNNGNMQIIYEIPENSTGTFNVYNLIGNKLFSYPLNGGKNSFTISRNDLINGIYYYQATAGGKVIAKDKIVIIK